MVTNISELIDVEPGNVMYPLPGADMVPRPSYPSIPGKNILSPRTNVNDVDHLYDLIEAAQLPVHREDQFSRTMTSIGEILVQPFHLVLPECSLHL